MPRLRARSSTESSFLVSFIMGMDGSTDGIRVARCICPINNNPATGRWIGGRVYRQRRNEACNDREKEAGE